VHRVRGTDICFIKRQGQVGQVEILGLDQPIPFRVPAKIALSHIAAIEPQLAHGNSFRELKSWLLGSGPNKFVMLNSPLQGEDPYQLNYSPVHHLTYRINGDAVSAVVTLFDIIKFSVFLGSSSHIPASHILMCLRAITSTTSKRARCTAVVRPRSMLSRTDYSSTL
jgi:hypothetical protein